MAKYFVDVEKEDTPPTYLTEQKPIIPGDPNLILPQNPAMNAPNNRSVKISVEGRSGVKYSLSVLEKHTWPSANQLGLDNSQFNALHAALTKELAVIQGPPGTGKTFMALKIAEILINNKDQMRRSTPILVVCLTNHALDQFLVGMLKFTDRLVRIGGQSKCQELDKFNMRNVRFGRSRQQYTLMDQLTEGYQKLSEFDHGLSCATKALQKSGVFLDLELNGVPLPRDWIVGNDLSHAFDGEFYSFAEMHRINSNNKHNDVEKLQAKVDEGNLSAEQAANWRFQIDQYYGYLDSQIYSLESFITSFEPTKTVGEKLAKSRNIYRLSAEERLELYFHILEKMKSSLAKEQKTLSDDVFKTKQKLDELRNMEAVASLRDQDVIGLTTNGAARLHTMLKAVGCEVGKIFKCWHLQVLLFFQFSYCGGSCRSHGVSHCCLRQQELQTPHFDR
jgi:hypothetical protein